MQIKREGTLSKVVPSKRKSIDILWCHMDAFIYDETFRRVRMRSKRKLDHCYWCRKEFSDSEVIALACVKDCGNKVFCQSCANLIDSPVEIEKEARDE